jgi:OOP family OmpA-OmpF porin
MNKKFFAAVLGLALVLPVAAQAEGMYVKLAAGQTQYSNLGTIPDLKPTGVQIGLGYSLDKTWDVEAGYIHFGKKGASFSDTVSGTTGDVSLETQSLYLAGIGNLAVTDAFSLFGKLGIAVNRSKATATTTFAGVTDTGSDSKTKTQALIGAGLSYQFTKELAGLVDYTYYGKAIDSDEKLSLLSVGLRYNF